MSAREDTADYRSLFLNNTPLIDVRAPVEFAKGAFPNSVNVPLLDDLQREAVGTRYNEQGQDSAIELGWELITPDVQAQRISDWQTQTNANPEGYLYCFRGGLRSRLSQQLLKEQGTDYPFIEGGYKAMRRFLIDEIEASAASTPYLCIGGRTCSGKTIAIHQLQTAVDLEGLANHRGSSFGRQLEGQPTQINFENRLAVALIKLKADNAKIIYAEDESKNIGSLSIPPVFLEHLRESPMAIIEMPLEQRVDLAIEEYIVKAFTAHQQFYGEENPKQLLEDGFLASLDRIKKRLGGERHKTIRTGFEAAFKDYANSGELSGFAPGMSALLTDYYDPMYDYQLEKRNPNICFTGSIDDFISWTEHATDTI
ncbi:MAG: tRNA 2-selenouridine(34) synthase MnmH [Methylococcales bacterium]|jgi:tRNA 2-selenouridine synthase|nr:tRNA 2-selenouridine(34) synthase MnmH [Methylococcales bacterium]MBT7444463.1 tRNA 2-selenouridine(34) synthase MnmH [Methylococcales bacterium]